MGANKKRIKYGQLWLPSRGDWDGSTRNMATNQEIPNKVDYSLSTGRDHQ